MTELFNKQKALDATILEKHPIGKADDRMAKKVLAFQVELGELANEFRSFKFWSEDQKPRYQNLLTEYVDCLHFIVSIGLELGVEDLEINEKVTKPKAFADKTTIQRFIGLNAGVANLYYANKWTISDTYHDIFEGLVKLAYQLGYTWEEVLNEYEVKNKINHERQENNY